MPAGTISPQELRKRLDGGESVFILDVREPWEVELAAFEGSVWIPLDELPVRVPEIPLDQDVVCICHTGIRSAFAARALSDGGHPSVFNMIGGVDRWSREVDATFPRY